MLTIGTTSDFIDEHPILGKDMADLKD